MILLHMNHAAPNQIMPLGVAKGPPQWSGTFRGVSQLAIRRHGDDHSALRRYLGARSSASQQCCMRYPAAWPNCHLLSITSVTERTTISWNVVCSLWRSHENGCEKDALPRDPAWSNDIENLAAMVPLTRRCAIGSIPNELIVGATGCAPKWAS